MDEGDMEYLITELMMDTDDIQILKHRILNSNEQVMLQLAYINRELAINRLLNGE